MKCYGPASLRGVLGPSFKLMEAVVMLQCGAKAATEKRYRTTIAKHESR